MGIIGVHASTSAVVHDPSRVKTRGDPFTAFWLDIQAGGWPPTIETAGLRGVNECRGFPLWCKLAVLGR
ncbi:hypothetical protein E1A91_A03G067100v1 [Gossypium mustelinum]|uniref:Uncharacterized protein n=1 Tax=Gossypium mustelinum TaxID=34275 RepID=A0A5D2ZWQ0_GOSMU|nr:hypothetical protein E1A91_A03G067100v1 [Gossypium mustelinum]